MTRIISKEEYRSKLFKKYKTNSYLELRKKMTDSEFDGLISLKTEQELLSDPIYYKKAREKYTKWHYRKVQ